MVRIVDWANFVCENQINTFNKLTSFIRMTRITLLFLTMAAVPLVGMADDTTKPVVLTSADAWYDHTMPMHLITGDELKARLTSTNSWLYDKFNFYKFPLSFDKGGNITKDKDGNTPTKERQQDTGWIIPQNFTTTKVGTYLEVEGQMDDDATNTSLTSIANWFGLLNSLADDGTPTKQTTSGYLFQGSSKLRYYINQNTNTDTKGSMTTTLAPGKIRFRITTDILNKLQTNGLVLIGSNFTFTGINVVDPFAVFPGKDKKDVLKVGGPNYDKTSDWWKNAIHLDQKLFESAKPGYVLRVYTTPDLSTTQTSSEFYTGYPTNTNMSKTALGQTDDETSQVYFQVITGSSSDVKSKEVDKGWDYMNGDAAFVLTQDDIDKAKTTGNIPQIIVRDATIRKISIDPVWSKRQTFTLSKETKTLPDQDFTKEGTDESMSVKMYLRNIQGLQPKAGDQIRVQFHTVTSTTAEMGMDFFGDNTTFSGDGAATGNADNFLHKSTISKGTDSYTITLDQSDIDKINAMQTEKPSDPQWYWLVIKGRGVTVTGVSLIKNTEGIMNHDVYMSEDNETANIGEEKNVNVHLKRTFTKGKWATIMFPFSLNQAQINAAFGPNSKVGFFIQSSSTSPDETETVDGKKYKVIKLNSTNRIVANTPQVLQINDDGYIPSDNTYVFNNVDISMFSPKNGDANYGNGYVAYSPFVFFGTFGKIPQLPKYALYLVSKKNTHHNNEVRQDFYWVGDNTLKNGGASMKGFRWYAYYGGNESGIEASYYTDPLGYNNAKVLFYFDGVDANDDTVTGINSLFEDEEEQVDENASVFTLAGQYVGKRSQLDTLPNGIYVSQGKKIIVK